MDNFNVTILPAIGALRKRKSAGEFKEALNLLAETYGKALKSDDESSSENGPEHYQSLKYKS